MLQLKMLPHAKFAKYATYNTVHNLQFAPCKLADCKLSANFANSARDSSFRVSPIKVFRGSLRERRAFPSLPGS